MDALLIRQLNTVRVPHPFPRFCGNGWEYNVTLFLPDQLGTILNPQSQRSSRHQWFDLSARTTKSLQQAGGGFPSFLLGSLSENLFTGDFHSGK
jgi:hypothetical protein